MCLTVSMGALMVTSPMRENGRPVLPSGSGIEPCRYIQGTTRLVTQSQVCHVRSQCGGTTSLRDIVPRQMMHTFCMQHLVTGVSWGIASWFVCSTESHWCMWLPP
jgi:hypothetical protein